MKLGALMQSGPAAPADRTQRGDLLGGTVAGIVALPLMLAFGEASGAGPIAGVWGAIIVGFFAAILGGTPSMVSGPTGPMIVVFAGVFTSVEGDLSLVFPAVVLAGLLQIAFGVMGIGKYIKLVPYPVISGFMSGIGVIIIVLQLSRLVGSSPSGSGTIAAIESIPDAFRSPDVAATALGVLTLLIVFLWPSRWAQYLPGALIALIVGTIIGSFLTVPVIGDIPLGFPDFTVPGFSSDTITVVLEGAIILAILGSIDTLLTSLIADNLTQTRHASDRELVGQGIGNAFAGLFGAMPGAGATSTTVVSMRSGGRGRLAGATHAIVLAAIVLIAGPLAESIPHSVLAGILIKVGVDILDVSYLRRAHRGPRLDLVLMVVVLAMTVLVDLISAVAVGVVLAALGFVKRLADQQLENFDPDEGVFTDAERRMLREADGRIAVFRFDGPLSFGAAADLSHEARERMHGDTGAMVLDFGRLAFVDMSAILAIETILAEASKSRTSVFVCRMNDEVQQALTRVDVPEHFSFMDRPSAIEAALSAVRGRPAEPQSAG
jgi:SulP family sulfate permease